MKVTSERKFRKKQNMNVSVIIAAYNAEKTIADTLKSLQNQTFKKWEAIVIDDGSSDDTSVIAGRFANQDHRIRIISQQNSGPCIARNAGIRMAHFDWLLFLDADDWIAPTHLQRMLETLMADADLDAVHCGYVYVAPNGTLSDEMYGNASADLFPTLARHCPFPIHACVVRKAIVEEIGGWDPSLRTSEDWDLWQRISRFGAQFGTVKQVLAYYRMKPNSLSRNGNQEFIDGMRVLIQGHSFDQRVPNPHPSHREGEPSEILPELRCQLASWIAGITIGQGEDARRLLNLMGNVSAPDLSPFGVVDNLFKSVPLSACQLPTDWFKLWPSVEKNIKAFLVALETRSHSLGLSDRAISYLERMVLQHTEITGPLTLGTTHAVPLEVTKPLPDIRPPSGVKRLFGIVVMEGIKLGGLELPVIDGMVTGWVLEDAIAANFAWAILGRFFEHTVYLNRKANEHDQIGWKTFWQQLWGSSDWADGHGNDSMPKVKPYTTKQVNSDRLMVEVSEDLSDLNITFPKVKVGFTVGGVPLGVVTIPVKNNLLKASTLRVALARASRYELLRVCAREALIGKPLHEPISLRSRLARAVVLRAHHSNLSGNGIVSPQTVVLGGRPGRPGTCVSRRAVLPRIAALELLEMAQISGEPVFQHVDDEDPDRVLYAPELLEHLLVEKDFSRSTIPLPRPPRWTWFLKWALKNPVLLAILHKFKQTYRKNENKLPIFFDSRVLPKLWEFLIFCSPVLPILMYHRVAPCSDSVTKRYVVNPEAFEKQLRYLRDSGFYNVSLDEWLNAMLTDRPLPDRAIALTFEDGYQNFYDYAFPLLKKYAFTATVFLIAGSIGKSLEKEERLMGWQEIHHLKDEGILFGSHSFNHRSLTSLSDAEIVQEGAQSRALLIRELGIPVTAFSYPYGHFDATVEHLIGACGYTIGVSTWKGLGSLHGNPLALPRIEVMGSYTFQDFVNKINQCLVYSFKHLLSWLIHYRNEAEDF